MILLNRERFLEYVMNSENIIKKSRLHFMAWHLVMVLVFVKRKQLMIMKLKKYKKLYAPKMRKKAGIHNLMNHMYSDLRKHLI